MIKFILGVVVGAVIATIGFTGVAHYAEKAAIIADHGVHKAIVIAKDVTK
jgi:hypothetical protein